MKIAPRSSLKDLSTLGAAAVAIAILSLGFSGCAPVSKARPATTADASAAKATEAELAAKAKEPSPPPAPPSETVQVAPEPETLITEPGDEDLESTEGTEPSPLDELPENGPQVAPGDLERDKNLVAQGQAASFDIPMVLNDKVAAYVDYFTNAHRSFFEASLARSGRYVETFVKIFEEAGIPKDLVYMAHVESAFKTNAYSRAQAKGIFQFISWTGRRYGLRIDGWIDERSDPRKSARAAAAYLKDLYGMFGDWYLALAAYNAGEGKIQRSLEKTGKTDFWSLASTRSLRHETKDYVPAILAATLIAKDPAKFGFSVTPETEVPTDVVPIDGQTDLRILARLAGTDVDTLRQLNPQLRRGATPPSTVTDVRVPAGLGETTKQAYAALPDADRMILARHQVAKGETVSAVAAHYGVATAAILRANGLAKTASLKAGQQLVIPATAAPAHGGSDAFRSEAVSYRVRSGDTLSSIARQYRTSPAAIADVSGIGVHSTLHVGQRLRIPASRGAAASRAGSASSASSGGTSTAKKSGASLGSVVHTVRRGETLVRIAGAYRVTVDQICSLNNIPADGVLYPGTRLKIRTN
jgi:membrane-bound lytic murein transglycosylase D